MQTKLTFQERSIGQVWEIARTMR